MPLVTISAAYGAHGREVGSRLAEELGVPFLDRAIPAAVAQTLAVPLAEVETRDEVLGGFLERLLGTFAQMGGIHGGAIAPLPDVPDEAAFRAATERILREHAASDGGVILGRAGMIVLADQPGVLRVRLTGPVEARIEQAIRSNGLTAEAARRECDGSDAARAAYVHRFYGVDIRDPALYDLVINATRWTVSELVGLIRLALEAASS